MNESLTSRVLAVFPFLKTNPQLCKELVQSAMVRSFATGIQLYFEGEVCGQIVFVLDGEIRVLHTKESGREITLYELAAGDTCVC